MDSTDAINMKLGPISGGGLILLIDRRGKVLGHIANPNISDSQELADHTCALIDEHNGLMAEVARLTALVGDTQGRG